MCCCSNTGVDQVLKCVSTESRPWGRNSPIAPAGTQTRDLSTKLSLFPRERSYLRVCQGIPADGVSLPFAGCWRWRTPRSLRCWCRSCPRWRSTWRRWPSKAPRFCWKSWKGSRGRSPRSPWRSACEGRKAALPSLGHLQISSQRRQRGDPQFGSVQSCSVQDGIYVLGKAHMRSTLSDVYPSVACETVSDWTTLK